jgi:hypothetical protein
MRDRYGGTGSGIPDHRKERKRRRRLRDTDEYGDGNAYGNSHCHSNLDSYGNGNCNSDCDRNAVTVVRSQLL